MIQIPPDRLPAETLQAVIEAFVVREGTDYGDSEISFAAKVNQVSEQVKRGDVVICFDPATESCTLITRTEYSRLRHELFD